MNCPLASMSLDSPGEGMPLSRAVCIALIVLALALPANARVAPGTISGPAFVDRAVSATLEPLPGFSLGTPVFSDGFESGDLCGWLSDPAGPTIHSGGVILVDETWTAAGSPHDVVFDTSVGEDVTLTLEPCASVRVAAGTSITVLGRLLAPGQPDTHVHIGALDEESWATLGTFGSGVLDLAWTTIEGGGNPLNVVPSLVAMIDVRGDQYQPTQELIRVDHVTLSGSASQGILLAEGAGFSADSTALVITGSAGAPLNSWPRAVRTIPPGTYTGNGDDQILIPGLGGLARVQEDATWHDRGVPYHVGTPGTFGILDVSADSGLATLTIEPGVTLRFKKEGVFYVEPFSGTDPARGALVAVGTAEEPIVFTSAEASPGAGDWLGIYFGSTPSADNQIEYAEVLYAGGLSGTGSFSCTSPVSDGRSEAAIRILGGEPASAFVTNSLIAYSAGYGFDRGWVGSDSVSFAGSNTFLNIAWCRQTSPIAPGTGCGEVEVPCP